MRLVMVVVMALVLTCEPAAAAKRLAGVTKVKASSSAYADVVVPTRLHFYGPDLKTMPRVRISGKGLAIVFALRYMGKLTAAEKGFGPDYVQFERLGPRGNRVEGVSGRFNCPCDDTELILKPGRYRLYLMSDRPARVRLRIPALSGRRTLRPRRPAPFRARPLGTFASPFPDTAVVGGWGTQTTDSGGMGMYAWFQLATAETLDRTEFCLLRAAETETDSGTEFGPGCSGALPDPVDTYALGDGMYGLHATISGFPAGRYGLGANLTHLGQTVPAGGVGFWATFKDRRGARVRPSGRSASLAQPF